MSQDTVDDAPDEAMLSRVRLPGRLLSGIGFANVVAGLMLLHTGIQTWRKTPEEFLVSEREMVRQAAEWGVEYHDAGAAGVAQRKDFFARLYLGWAALALAGAFFATYGGFNMRTLNSYRVAMTGAILSAFPPTSPAAMLGIGVVVGIWAIVVLCNGDVRAAFADTPMETES
jgi:hypothetical protein